MLIDLPTTGETLAPIANQLPFGHSRVLIPNGIEGTAKTIAMMQKLVAEGKRDDRVREVVGSIINPAGGGGPAPKDYFNYAKALYTWVRDNIKYAYDPTNVEYLESPYRVLKNKIADCDSQDMLLCAMFEQVGLKSQFVTIKADASRPDEYTHVYTRVFVPRVGWVCADPIMHNKWFGWEPPYANKRYWPSSSDHTREDLDNSPSVPFPTPDASPSSFNPVTGMSGFSDLGRRHRGGRGRRWGGGWGGPVYWGGGFDENIYLLPVAVPMPDQVGVVPNEDVNSATKQNPLLDQDNKGFGGFFDDPIGTISSAFTGATASLSASARNAWLTRIFNGSVAASIKMRRAKANANSDLAYRYIQAAKKSGSTSALQAATRFRDAAIKEQRAIDDEIRQYDVVVGIIKDYSFGKFALPAAVGVGSLGVEPLTAATYIAVSGATGLIATTAGIVYLIKRNADAIEAQETTNREKIAAEREVALLQSGATAQQVLDARARGQATSPADWSSYLGLPALPSTGTLLFYGAIVFGGYLGITYLSGRTKAYASKPVGAPA